MPEATLDVILPFTVPALDARGRMVRLGPVLCDILAPHAYPAPMRKVLAEALVLAALMGSLAKGQDDSLTMQMQASGGLIDLLVCDYRNGQIRGYLSHDAEKLAQGAPAETLEDLFGTGYFAITYDVAETGARYQGIVPIEGASLAHACETYFAQSEQIPSLITVGIEDIGGELIAGGMLLQHMPEGEEGGERLHVAADNPNWQHVSVLGSTMSARELTDPVLSLSDLVWRLFHEEDQVLTYAMAQVSKGCRCSAAHFAGVLKKFPPDEVEDMKDEGGIIKIDCAFCSKIFDIIP